GISTLYMALSAKSSEVFTIEGCGNRLAIAKSNFHRAGAVNIHIVNSDFDTALPEIFLRSGIPGMIFIDGNHRREAVLRYLSIISRYIDENTLIVLDDIYHSREMGQVWEDLKALKDITVTIDLFQFGLVFYKRGIDKQHFIIRY
ncbi:MAG: class I SAM-dependent methyltransferase, partial [Bacteroidales bacterium]|nr:class I SAM-dependent methyltransferase [Bacteroidales bacterium]